MIKVGITGSISSGKTTASKIISKNRGPLFSADKVVKKIYLKDNFKRLIAKKLGFKFGPDFKKMLKYKILTKKNSLNKLEKTIHPIVRKEMLIFQKRNKNKKYLFFEIPLLIESNLIKHFDKIIFLKASRSVRLKRFKLNGGNEMMFKLLDGNQIKDTIKMKECHHVVVNNKAFSILKKNLSNIVKNYE